MNLEEMDLDIDEVYQGSRNGNSSDDPLPRLLGVDNGAGFRHLGKRPGTDTLKLLVLKSNFNDPDWPDHLDYETGLLTYYGDNKKVGDLHATPRQGNLILKNLFETTHTSSQSYCFPVILVFGGTGVYRDVRFLGLAVPGAASLGPDEDLVALWRSNGPSDTRFQNYKARFTVLDVPRISRAWLDDVANGNAVESQHAPKAWLDWVFSRKYLPLVAPHSLDVRSKAQQLPAGKVDKNIIQLIYDNYCDDPFGFEGCAVAIAQLMMPDIEYIDLTRPWRDGGRDALGKYRIGTGKSAIDVDFALEAKCYQSNTGVGVKALSRLISRLRHRQFGILVTTSYLSEQAYQELKEDAHPIVIIAANDIVRLIKEKISSDKKAIENWLDSLAK
jgi:hypothetical protein